MPTNPSTDPSLDGPTLDALALDRLADPSPPSPGHATRAAVNARAGTLARRRRLAQGGGVLAAAVVLSVGAVALATAGSGGLTHAADVQVASGAETGTGATAAPVQAFAGSSVTVDASAAGLPAGVDLQVTLVGDHGTFRTSVRTPGTITFDAAPGDYELSWEWSSDDGSASAVGCFPVTVTDGTTSFSITSDTSWEGNTRTPTRVGVPS